MTATWLESCMGCGVKVGYMSAASKLPVGDSALILDNLIKSRMRNDLTIFHHPITLEIILFEMFENILRLDGSAQKIQSDCVAINLM